MKLTEFSLVQENEGFISLHRLVQEVIRNELAGDISWISCCLNIAYNAFEYKWGNEASMKAFEHNAQHVLQIAQYAEEFWGEDEEAQKKIAWLYNEAGNGYDYSGQYGKALELL